MLTLYITLIILNLILSAIPIFKEWKSIANFAFSISSVSLLCWMFSCYMLWNSDDMLFWVRMAFVGPSFLPTSLFLFVTHFPKKTMTISPFKIVFLLSISILFAVLALTNFIVIDIKSMTDVTFNIGHKIWSLYFLGFMASIFTVLYKKIRKYTGEDQKRIAYVAYGIILTIGMAVVFNLIFPLLGITNFTNIGPLSVSFLIYFSLYAMLKHELMDMKIVLGWYLSFAVVGLFVVMSYFVLFFFLEGIALVKIGSVLLAIVWVIFGKTAHQTLITTAKKKFIKGWFDYKRVLNDTVENLSSCTNTADVATLLQNLFEEILEIDQVEIFMPDSFEHKKDISTEYVKINIENNEKVKINNEILILLNKVGSKKILKKQLLENNIKVLEKNNLSIVLPCVFNDKILAILLIGNKVGGGSFNTNDLDFLDALSAILPITLNRIRQARVSAELNVAQRIQNEILPKVPKVFGLELAAHMQPAEEVGGDYYDILNFENDSWIVLGDVVGHGVAAGLTMFMVQSILTTLLTTNKINSPAELNFLANRILFNNLERLNEQRPMTIITLTTNNGRNFKVSGSHDNIYIYRANQNKVEVKSVENFPLGIGLTDMLERESFGEDEFELHKDDILFLATDGIVEAPRNGDDAQGQFGEEALIKLIENNARESVSNLKQAIIAELDTFTNKTYLDDITFIIAKAS